ncbi:MAG: glycosyltransferase family 39 protein [Candidatus Aenigmarchaeota archaeon]|nr:glycosyltransferase family 39 protein [Candidatus Aenigmarchaeota archaeon]
MEKEITIEIKKPEVILLLGILLVFLTLELQVSMNSFINFGDEGYHTRMAQYIYEEKEYPVFTPFEGSNLEREGFARPPLWNLLEAGFFLIFGLSETIVKFLTPFIAFLTGLAVFILVKKLFNQKVAFLASIISVTVPSFATYSILFYTDILFTFFMSLFFLLFILAIREDSKKYWFLSGIFGALALLTKIPGLVVYLFVALVFLYQLLKEKKFLTLFKKYFPLLLTIFLIPSTWILRNWYYFGSPCYNIPFIKIFDTSGCRIDKFQEKYQFAGRVEQVGTEQSVYRIGITSYLDFAYGPSYFVVLAFLCGLILLSSRKEMISDILFISLIMLLAIFYISTGRAEDAARYTLGWVSIIALISARWFEEIYNFMRRYQKYLALVVFVFVVFLSYQNLTGKLDIMARVKQFSPTFFEACDWIKKNTNENALISTIWCHRSVYNCQRSATPYMADMALSKDLNYTLSVAKEHGITHLFIQKFSIDLQNQHLQEKYDAEFVRFLENNPEYFKKIYENGPSLQQCLQQGICDGNIVYEIVY